MMLPGQPRRFILGETVILSWQHPYGESEQLEPIGRDDVATRNKMCFMKSN